MGGYDTEIPNKKYAQKLYLDLYWIYDNINIIHNIISNS